MPRTGGRVRSVEAHEAVLSATTAMLQECGLRAITIEAVAERSQVAKSTIYRWWRSKADLVMEAYNSLTASSMPEPDTGFLEQDLRIFVAALHRNAADQVRTKALRSLMVEAQLDPDFEQAFQSWVQGRRNIVLHILDRGRQRGELRPDTDPDIVVDQLFGLFWYRLLIGHLALDQQSAKQHVAHLLRGVTA